METAASTYMPSETARPTAALTHSPAADVPAHGIALFDDCTTTEEPDADNNLRGNTSYVDLVVVVVAQGDELLERICRRDAEECGADGNCDVVRRPLG